MDKEMTGVFMQQLETEEDNATNVCDLVYELQDGCFYVKKGKKRNFLIQILFTPKHSILLIFK